jgi:hypothetical protein
MEICALYGDCLVQVSFKVLNIADRGQLVQSWPRPLILTVRWLYYFVRLAINKSLHRLNKVDCLIEHLLFESQVTLSQEVSLCPHFDAFDWQELNQAVHVFCEQLSYSIKLNFESALCSEVFLVLTKDADCLG